MPYLAKEFRLGLLGLLTATAFSVSDDGPGIAPAFHQRIFQMFQTLKPRDQIEGSGMGLALVKKTVETHGGTIELESTEDHGALFRFTWPSSTQDR